MLLSDTPDIERINSLARVPEHSLALMRAMSGGDPFCCGQYLFFASGGWLMAIGYPLRGEYSDESFEAALAQAISRCAASSCYAIGSSLPARLAPRIVDSDSYYVLSSRAPIPSRLGNQAKKAAEVLTISETDEFTPGHRRLWSEFLGRTGRGEGAPMSDRVRELYARVPQGVGLAGGNLRFLDASDQEGHLVASLLLDFGPDNFVSYILGAHSKKHYVPHAADLLFHELIRIAGERGKRFIHLGLGVNEGILRFKLKWGARKSLPYRFAQWDIDKGGLPGQDENINVTRAFAVAIMRSQGGLSARQFLGESPACKPFAMLWRLEKEGRVSWIGGTAHFFCHSFEPSFRRLFRNVDNVIFEGPLDADFMARVDKAGKTLPAGFSPLIDLLTEEDILELERTVHGPRGRMAKLLGMARTNGRDVRWYLQNALPWSAFFSLWTSFLERQGWHESVDMEAWRIATEMGKNVIGMETLEEQLDSLGSLPVERVIRFFRSCRGWKARSRRNMRAYLAGDLEKMMGSSAEFPTRTEYVIGRRDQRFLERMLPYIEQGRAAVFVGSAHMVNLRHMLADKGFLVRQTPFGIWPKFCAGMRRLAGREDTEW